jgi:SH3-like domain-containing protein
MKQKSLIKNVISAFIIIAISTSSYAAEKPTKGSATGLDLPRFASLKSNNINARKGPGPTYPLEVVFKRKSLPVEIIEEFKDWRQIKDIDGETGWVHKAMLSGNRFAITGDKSFLLKSEKEQQPVAEIEKGAQLKILECQQTLCKAEAAGLKGWVEKSKLWGVYANETFD